MIHFKSYKPILLILILVLCANLIIGCSANVQSEKITFKDLVENHEGQRIISSKAEELNGDVVTIEGWMSPLSPLKEGFFYLINVPGDNCPFCAGLEVDYRDVVIVYLEGGKAYDFTDDPISVTGTFDVGEKEDREGYFRIAVANLKRDIQDIKNTSN